MLIPRPSYTDIYTRMYQDITSKTSLSADINASALGVIIKSAAAEIDTMWSSIEALANSADVLQATGTALDVLGSNLGAPRLAAQKSSTLGYARSVQFTNLSGGTVTVNTGTRVYSSKTPQIAFFTMESVSIPSGQSAQVHVSAAAPGSQYNVPAGYLDSSSLTVAVSVTNLQPLRNGTLTESDDDYRVRLINEFRRRTVFNEQTCVSLMKSVPNVDDAILISQPRGPGTFDIIISPKITSDLSNTLSAAQSLLNQNLMAGQSALVKGPTYRFLDVAIQLTFNTSLVNQQAIRNNLITQIQNLITNQPIENGKGSATFNLQTITASGTYADPTVTNSQISIALDGIDIDSEGSIYLNLGEQLYLRSIVVN